MHVLVIAGSYNVCVYIGNVYNIILSVTNIFTPEKLLKKPELHIPFAHLTAGLVLNNDQFSGITVVPSQLLSLISTTQSYIVSCASDNRPHCNY